MPSDADFGDQLQSQTAGYLDRLDDCVGLLPVVLDEYAAGDDYAGTIEEIQTIESECDRTIRDITGLITNAGPDDIGLLNTRINYNESALVELFQNVDTVANLTERIAQELEMMRPPHDNDCFRGLREMSDEIRTMTATLERVLERFLASLRDTDASDTLIDEIHDIRAAETRCDDLRNDVIATAFREDGIDHPLMYREFAILFDDLANTIEDITDQIAIIASKEPGIVTEIDPDLE